MRTLEFTHKPPASAGQRMKKGPGSDSGTSVGTSSISGESDRSSLMTRRAAPSCFHLEGEKSSSPQPVRVFGNRFGVPTTGPFATGPTKTTTMWPDLHDRHSMPGRANGGLTPTTRPRTSTRGVTPKTSPRRQLGSPPPTAPATLLPLIGEPAPAEGPGTPPRLHPASTTPSMQSSPRGGLHGASTRGLHGTWKNSTSLSLRGRGHPSASPRPSTPGGGGVLSADVWGVERSHAAVEPPANFALRGLASPRTRRVESKRLTVTASAPRWARGRPPVGADAACAPRVAAARPYECEKRSTRFLLASRCCS